MSLETPLLFLIFRDPEKTFQTFQAISDVRPKKLYISADGPRLNHLEDASECAKTRNVVSRVDWDCEVHYRFLEINVGLKMAVSSALNWFFNAEEEGIILEYDCVPDPSFFTFCTVMLDRYRNDARVLSISGCNLQNGIKRGDGDYYFSRLFACWGWAAWKRTWALWSPNLPKYQQFIDENLIDSIIPCNESKNFWIHSFNSIHNGSNTSTWAFCMVYAHLIHGGYCIIPNRNLIKNIGFGINATHSKFLNHPCTKLEACSIHSFDEPSFILPDLNADIAFSKVASFGSPSSAYQLLKLALPAVLIRHLRRIKFFFFCNS
jgi:hypothetical protein